ncbi:hypothetical protein [Nocardia nova]|uniref:hypothetical protein n=1 Tax=Nocardia nova TaxID=37330 RepID=UPI0033DB7DAA
MGESTAQPLSHDEALAVLLDAIDPLLAAARRTIGIAHTMATVVGGEPLDLLNDAITDYRRHHRLVRAAYLTVRPRPATVAVDSDGQ